MSMCVVVPILLAATIVFNANIAGSWSLLIVIASPLYPTLSNLSNPFYDQFHRALLLHRSYTYVWLRGTDKIKKDKRNQACLTETLTQTENLWFLKIGAGCTHTNDIHTYKHTCVHKCKRTYQA